MLVSQGHVHLGRTRMVQAAGEMVPPTLTIIEVEEGWKLLDVGRFLDAFEDCRDRFVLPDASN